MVIFGFVFGYDSEVDIFDEGDYREVCSYDSAGYDGLFDDEYPQFEDLADYFD